MHTMHARQQAHQHEDQLIREQRDLVQEMADQNGWTLTELARKAGLVPSTVTRFMNNPDVKHALSARTLRKLSNASGVAIPEALAADGRQVPIVGYIGAGEEVFPFNDGPLDYTDAPADVGDDAIAVRVRGTSMFPAYWDGDLLIYRRDYSFVRDICLYNECIVKIKDGPTLVKRIMPGSTERTYTLLSYNAAPIIDARIEWAAPVQIHDKRKRRGKVVEQVARDSREAVRQ